MDGDPISYTGTISVTIHDEPCEAWTGSHWQNFEDVDFPDGSVAAASNFCRNPRNSEIGPWCYTGYDTFGACDVLWCSYVG